MSLRYPIGAASGVDVVSGVKVLGVVDVSLISISTPVTQAVKEQMLSKPNIICGPKNVIFRYGRIWSTSLSTPNNHVQMHTWYPVVSLLYVLGAERKTPMKDRLALESKLIQPEWNWIIGEKRGPHKKSDLPQPLW